MRIGTALALGFSVWAATTGSVRAQALTPGDLRAMFVRLDTNGDTAIDKDEVPESGQAAFQVLLKHGDTDGNGRLEASELRTLGEKLRAAGIGGQGNPAQQVKALDKDSDGKISREEFPGLPAVFARIDADKDGFLTLDELVAARKAAAAKAALRKKQDAATETKPVPSNPAAQTEAKPAAVTVPAGAPASAAPAEEPTPLGKREFAPRFKAMDRNSDGKVSREEFTGGEGGFDRFDADKDGSITPDEVAKAQTQAQFPFRPERFKRFDKNGDGKLSREEFPGRPGMFSRFDADKDGFLTPAEAARAATPAGAPAKKQP